MGKVESAQGSNSIDIISELPKDILLRILYFLSQEDVVRTSVLSKSWRYIWCTRPNLDFSDRNYFKRNKREFLSIVDKSLQRYCDQRVCVEEFHLRISFNDYLDQKSVLLLEKWIPLLTNMRQKVFCLSLLSDVGFEHSLRHLRLPPVVFAAQSLRDLRLERFMLDKKAIERIVLFKHLKSLRLNNVCIEDDEILHKIISNCPLIETLDLTKCRRLTTINANDLHNLKYFSFFGCSFTGRLCSIEIHPPSVETIDIGYGSLRFHKGAVFRNLDYLHLHFAKLSWDHLSSCKFPSLQRLHIYDCDGLKETPIFIDAPNIVYFKYEADDFGVPSISFATTSQEWKSDIQLRYSHANDASSSRFLRLKELLKSLSKSRISLTIREDGMNVNIQENINVVQDIISGGGNNPAAAVENLSLHCYRWPCNLSRMSYLLNCAFSICRPRNMKGHLGGMNMNGHERHKRLEESERVECLWKILMERESDEQFKHALWLQDLEDVSFEIEESYGGEWRPTSLQDLPNYQEMEFTRIRFAFKWRRLHL